MQLLLISFREQKKKKKKRKEIYLVCSLSLMYIYALQRKSQRRENHSTSNAFVFYVHFSTLYKDSPRPRY